MDHATYFRWVLIIGGILLFIAAVILFLMMFRKMVLAERLFGGAVLCFMLYIGDALRAAIAVDLGFAWRLIPLAIGEFLFTAWLLEPMSARRARQQNSVIKRRSQRS